MLKKLKRKYSIITVSLVGLVLASVLMAICVSTYQSQMNSAKSLLTNEISYSINKSEISSFNPGTLGRPRDPEQKKRAPSYASTFLCTDAGDVAFLNNDLLIDYATAQAVSERVADEDDSFGSIPRYNLYYRTMWTQSEGTIIAVTYSTAYRKNYARVYLVSAVLFVCGLIIIYLMSMFLGSIVLKPVMTAWDQQQQFLADASHELKTPLTVILANNNILMSHPDSTISDQRKWLDSTQKEATHMSSLINNLLFLARSDSGNDTSPVMSTVDFSDLCESSLLQFEPVAFEKSLLLDGNIQKDISVRGDQTQLTQLTHILLDNACKYTPEGGKIFMSLSETGHDTTLSVNNTGDVIPSYELSHLFERFYRSDKSRKKDSSSGGYGLGLAIAKTIAEKHGASITASSSTERGTTFSVVFRTKA